MRDGCERSDDLAAAMHWDTFIQHPDPAAGLCDCELDCGRQACVRDAVVCVGHFGRAFAANREWQPVGVVRQHAGYQRVPVRPGGDEEYLPAAVATDLLRPSVRSDDDGAVED